MNRFKDILCVLKPVETSKIALERAVTLAENNQASLTVVNVVPRITAGIGMPEGGPISVDLQDAMISAQSRALDTLIDPYRKRLSIKTKVLLGTPFLEIIREVLRSGCDLVIKYPEAQDWLDRLFGSDDMHLFRKCPCPIWSIKPKAPKSYQCVVAAVDVDREHPPEELIARHALNRKILEMAISLALSEFAELHIVHAWSAMGESAMRGVFIHTPEEVIVSYVEQVKQQHQTSLDSLIREVINDLGQDSLAFLKPHTHLVKGSPRKEIPALAERIEADLVVMGTVSRTGVPGFIMGNTAETILDQINCSVLAVKPPGFVTPVTLET